jgi:hypothetical protein
LFKEFDVTRTMVDDHLVPTGYNALLLETMRSHLKDSQFEFRNNVMTLVKMVNQGTTGTSDEYTGTSDEYTGTSDEYTGTSDEYTGTSDEYVDG